MRATQTRLHVWSLFVHLRVSFPQMSKLEVFLPWLSESVRGSQRGSVNGLKLAPRSPLGGHYGVKMARDAGKMVSRRVSQKRALCVIVEKTEAASSCLLQ